MVLKILKEILMLPINFLAIMFFLFIIAIGFCIATLSNLFIGTDEKRAKESYEENLF